MGWFSRNLNKYIGKAINKYYVNSFEQIGDVNAAFDFNRTWAIETAYVKNPDVYAVINQISNKTAQVPCYIQEVKDKKALSGYAQNRKNITLRHLKLKNQAFKDEYLSFPLPRPNPLYGWKHFKQLFSTYLNSCGEVYIYKHKNEIDEIVGYYILPSHLMQIYIKGGNALEFSESSPIAGYEMYVSTGKNIPFAEDEILHIKLPNPVWTSNGEQLYGFSPLKAAYYNVENVIQANKHLYKMFKSSGAFGFIFARGEGLDVDQAKQFKERIVEMDNSNERLARLSGIGMEIGFTRIALDNKELEVWNALSYDRKTICNVLGWNDELLNNDGKARLGGDEANEARKRVLLDTIVPQLELLEEVLTKEFSENFKGYENTRVVFDVSEMPECQDDINKIVEWATKAALSANEIRALVKYEPYNSDIADKPLLPSNLITIDEMEARGFDIPLNDE